MATVPVDATCYGCKDAWLVEMVKWNENCAEIWHRSDKVLENLKLIVNAAPCWA